MSEVIVMPEIKIGDLIEVRWNGQFKIYELDDIACWEKNHSIKTVNFAEHVTKYHSYQWKSKKEFDGELKRIRTKAKLIFKSGDKLLIKCSHDSVPYTLDVDSWHDEMRSVHFRKMMTT